MNTCYPDRYDVLFQEKNDRQINLVKVVKAITDYGQMMYIGRVVIGENFHRVVLRCTKILLEK